MEDDNFSDYLGLSAVVLENIPIVSQIISAFGFQQSLFKLQMKETYNKYGENECGVLKNNYLIDNSRSGGVWYTNYYLYSTGDYLYTVIRKF